MYFEVDCQRFKGSLQGNHEQLNKTGALPTSSNFIICKKKPINFHAAGRSFFWKKKKKRRDTEHTQFILLFIVRGPKEWFSHPFECRTSSKAAMTALSFRKTWPQPNLRNDLNAWKISRYLIPTAGGEFLFGLKMKIQYGAPIKIGTLNLMICCRA